MYVLFASPPGREPIFFPPPPPLICMQRVANPRDDSTNFYPKILLTSFLTRTEDGEKKKLVPASHSIFIKKEASLFFFQNQQRCYENFRRLTGPAPLFLFSCDRRKKDWHLLFHESIDREKLPIEMFVWDRGLFWKFRRIRGCKVWSINYRLVAGRKKRKKKHRVERWSIGNEIRR